MISWADLAVRYCGMNCPLTAECPVQCFRGSDLARRPAQNPS
jgi:hypothetical protein